MKEKNKREWRKKVRKKYIISAEKRRRKGRKKAMDPSDTLEEKDEGVEIHL